jgi:hypothetical protein
MGNTRRFRIWTVFLPRLHTLCKVVKCPDRYLFADLSLESRGGDARYRYIK